MFKKLLNLITGDPQEKALKELRPIVEGINELEERYQPLSLEELRNQTPLLRERLDEGETLDDILPEAFALVREASRRVTGLRHYDVQLMGGILLHRGQVIEMRTGEGKTLVATLPLYLNALSGEGVHLVTVNEYLARRDGGWMGKIFHSLGLTVGCIGPQQFSALYDPDYVNPGAELEDERLVHWRPCTRPEAYQADITYGISSEFGFDYLRDNMANHPDNTVQRSLHFAVIDEVDNVLIDEARTPLIISGPAAHVTKDYIRFSQYVRGLKPNTAEDDEEPNGDYDIDHKSRSISLTDPGIAKMEERIEEINPAAGESIYDPQFYHLTYYLDNALKAQYLFRRDKEYVVQGDEVIIVDESTGRLMPGRRYSDGLHEAIEAKEGVNIQRETTTVATITLQNYFRLYDKLAGMTGTAMTDAEEFFEIYKLEVSPLPTNVDYIVMTKQMDLEERRRKVEGAEAISYYPRENGDKPLFFKRIDFPDQVYGVAEARDQAIVAEIERVRAVGRPILVGTTSVEHSEKIDKLLRARKIPHAVLNAKRHQSEALVVAQAGRKGAVTISTNMAGRGTDILLGGNPEGMAAEIMEKELFDRQLLGKLAYQMLAGGEADAREMAQKNAKLSEDLVDGLARIKADYDEALVEIEQYQVDGYLARRLQGPYDIDYNDVREVIRLVRGRRLREAREYLTELGKDVALVDDVVRLRSLYLRYQMDHADARKAADFLAELFFEKHYNARAALIRAVLAGNRDEAENIVRTVPGLPAKFIDKIEALLQETQQEKQKVWELGGLHVIGSERHESRRIDNQLRGRAARQGDPGSSRFFLSLEDELMLRFGGERLKNFMTRTNVPDDMPIESSVLDRIVESAQERIEGYNFDMRKNVVEYDDVMSKQRQAIYEERRRILMGENVDLDERVEEAFEVAVAELSQNYLEDYQGFIQSKVDEVVTQFSTDATDYVNVPVVLMRLRGLLPAVTEVDPDEWAGLKPRDVSRELMKFTYQNLESGRNIYQLLQEMGRFIPLLPPVPNLAATIAVRRSGHLQARENARRAYQEQVKSLFDDFLAEHLPEEQREEIWHGIAERIDEAFSQFAVEGLSRKAMADQQDRFRQQVDDALQDLLLDSLSALNREQLVEALLGYIDRQRDLWRERIGEEEFQNFQRLLLLNAIDQEWREYLTAVDDLRREIGLQAIGQRDPKIEYKRRSYEMFADMRNNIERSIVDHFFRAIENHQKFIEDQQAAVAYQAQMSQAGYQVVQREHGRGVELRREMPKVGRNDDCPCGSGKKYKHCHMRKDQAAANGQQAARRRQRRR